MLENIDKDSPEFDVIHFAYYRAKEQGKEAEFSRKLNLTGQDVQLLEKEVDLANACGDFDELRRKGVNVDLAEYLRQRGFAEEDIEKAKQVYAFTDSFSANTPKKKIDELLDLFKQIKPNLDEDIEWRIITNFSKEEIVELFG